jgi:hypothetical protein
MKSSGRSLTLAAIEKGPSPERAATTRLRRSRTFAPPPWNGEVRPKSRKAAFVATVFLFGEVGRSSGGAIDIPPTALALRVPAVTGLLRDF